MQRWSVLSIELPTANRKFARRGFLYKPSKFALAARNLAAVITKQHIEDEVSSKLPANERESFMTRRRRWKQIQLMSSVLPRRSTPLERSLMSGWEWWETIGTSCEDERTDELWFFEFMWTNQSARRAAKKIADLLYSNNKFLSNNKFFRARAPTLARFGYIKHTSICRRPYNGAWKKPSEPVKTTFFSVRSSCM